MSNLIFINSLATDRRVRVGLAPKKGIRHMDKSRPGEGVPSYGDDVGKIMLHIQHHDDIYAELDGEWEPSLYETTETETETDAETEIVVETADKTVEKQTEDDDEETTTTVVLDDVPASE